MNPTPEYQPELWCQPLCESKTYMLGLVYYRGGTTHLDALFLNDSLNFADGPSESVRTCFGVQAASEISECVDQNLL